MIFGRMKDYRVTGNSISIIFEQGTGVIDLFTDTIINVFAGLKTKEHYSKAIEDRDEKLAAAKVNIDVRREPDCLVITTPQAAVRVYDDFKVDFYDGTGKLVCRDYRGKREKQATVSPAFIELMKQEGHVNPNTDTMTIPVQAVKELQGDECFYGLGDKMGYLNKRHYEYEMWNTDNPEPQEENFKRLYKDLPFFITLGKDYEYGIFFDNTFHAYFDMGKEQNDYYYFGAEDGNLDYYYIAGASIPEIVEGYAYLTGTAPLPQLWTLGYQQSRWGYTSEEEIRTVASHMRKAQIPCDAIHFDIDYMDGYRVFTWNQNTYADPKKLMADLKEDGFKPVCIIDPGVKQDKGYDVYEEGMDGGYFATTPDGDVYVNAVWPGDSVYPDFGQKEVRSWWADKHKFLIDIGVRGVWNDMNEPASFRGELPKDVVFHDEVSPLRADQGKSEVSPLCATQGIGEERRIDHSEMHNIYGHQMSKATYEGLKEHDGRRPFVITRACYAGSQKYTTGWTGDNHSIWRHLELAVPQLCSLGLSGMPIVGTDVGGFGSDTTPELLSRWVQVGCFSPFFRNHSAMGTKLQEPWQFDRRTLDINRKFIELRYKLLPYYYDLLHEEEKLGHPIMRPLVYHYEKDENVRNCNDEFLVGANILVAPVLWQGACKRMVYLPEGVWYDYQTKERIDGGCYFIADAPLDVCPVYIREGSILPNYPVQQYVGELEIKELILDVYPGTGTWKHFQDNGEDFKYREGEYNEYEFTLEKDGLFTVRRLHKGYEKDYESFLVRFQGEETHVSLEEGTDAAVVNLGR